MASTRTGEVAKTNGSSPNRWLFSKEQMTQAASLKCGITDAEELEFRQKSMRCITALSDRLNLSLRDNRGKMSQGCICAAMIHMHRFYYFHSFTMFDYKDVAAACLFLAGKSEECPRKLEHIVKTWWFEKFGNIRLDTQNYSDGAQRIVFIENIILQTIAFDLRIDLPHPIVLGAMHDISQGNRKIIEVAYFFSTDVSVFDVFCLKGAFKNSMCGTIPQFIDGVRWFQKTDAHMTEEKLKEMSQEFMSIYQSVKDHLVLKKFADKGDVIREPAELSSSLLTPPSAANSVPSSILPPPPLPPPPVALGIAKKVDMSDYKERKSMPSSQEGRGDHGHSSTNPPRRSFIPDASQAKGIASLPPVILPGMPPAGDALSKPPPLMASSSSNRGRDDRRKDYRQSTGGGGGGPPPKGPQPPLSHGNAGAYQPNGVRSGISDDDARRRAERDARERDKRKREHSTTQLNQMPEKRSRPSDVGPGMQNHSQGSSDSQHHSSGKYRGGPSSSSSSGGSHHPGHPPPLSSHSAYHNGGDRQKSASGNGSSTHSSSGGGSAFPSNTSHYGGHSSYSSSSQPGRYSASSQNGCASAAASHAPYAQPTAATAAAPFHQHRAPPAPLDLEDGEVD